MGSDLHETMTFGKKRSTVTVSDVLSRKGQVPSPFAKLHCEQLCLGNPVEEIYD